MIPNQETGWYHVNNYTMTEISTKVAMKIFGTKGVDTVSKNPKKMHLDNTFGLIEPQTFSKEEYNEVL